MRLERFDLDLPDDFAVAEMDAIHGHLSDLSEDRRQSPEWSEWAGACNGIVYRYLACDEHGTALADSLDQSLSPPQPERYRQERLLFSFFVEGLSCIECCYYGFYFVGAMVDAEAFGPGFDPQKVTRARVVQRYQDHFQSDEITSSLEAINASSELKVWGNVRNLLAHRATPGRHFYVGGLAEAEWLGKELSGNSIRERRSWLAETMQALLVPAARFVHERIE
jgi:hypothetical protein